MIGFWIYSVLTQQRHLVVAIRRDTLCRCGCRGWCTLHGIFRFLRWSLEALANHRFPCQRHDGSPWLKPTESAMSDGEREALAGLDLKLSGALTMVKADWSEYHHNFGFFAPTSILAPCPLCTCQRHDMYEDCGEGYVASWPPVSDAEYDAAAARCEIWCRIESAVAHRELISVLWFDKRSTKKSGLGLSLKHPCPTLGLRQGDRVEPCDALPHVRDLFVVSTFPITILIWRRTNETRIRHRNPLMSADLGIGVRTLSMDYLHALNLGVLKSFSARAVWELILSDAFETGMANQEALVEASC